jgi:hypothetical protein
MKDRSKTWEPSNLKAGDSFDPSEQQLSVWTEPGYPGINGYIPQVG